jgi:hypothetical protein
MFVSSLAAEPKLLARLCDREPVALRHHDKSCDLLPRGDVVPGHFARKCKLSPLIKCQLSRRFIPLFQRTRRSHAPGNSSPSLRAMRTSRRVSTARKCQNPQPDPVCPPLRPWPASQEPEAKPVKGFSVRRCFLGGDQSRVTPHTTDG